MPASASEPPDGISTVVSARRARIDGMVSLCSEPGQLDGQRVVGREVGHFGQQLEADAAFREHDRNEIQARRRIS